MKVLKSHLVIHAQPKAELPPAGTGLGDIVATFAQPVAKAIDKVAGTNLQNCQPCKKRQENWNKIRF